MSDFRLDIYADTDPGRRLARVYFQAPAPAAATGLAVDHLAARTDLPADRFGDLYANDGDNHAVYWDTISAAKEEPA